MTNFGDFRLTVFGQFNPTLTASMFIGRERELTSLKEFSDISIVNNFIDSSSADRYINK